MKKLQFSIVALMGVGLLVSYGQASEDFQEGTTSSFVGAKPIGDQTTLNDSPDLHRQLFLESSEDEDASYHYDSDSEGYEKENTSSSEDELFSNYYYAEKEKERLSDSDKENLSPQSLSPEEKKEKKRKREETEAEPKGSKKKLQRTQRFSFKEDQGNLTYRGKRLEVTLSGEIFFKSLEKYTNPFVKYEGLEKLKKIPHPKIGKANKCYRTNKNSYEEELKFLSQLISGTHVRKHREFLENHKKDLLESWISLESHYCSNHGTYVPVNLGQFHKMEHQILLDLARFHITPEERDFQNIKRSCEEELQKLKETVTPSDEAFLKKGSRYYESFFIDSKDKTRESLDRKIGNLQKIQEIFFSKSDVLSAEEVFLGLIQIWDYFKPSENSQTTTSTTSTS